jgi:hypothetical protein
MHEPSHQSDMKPAFMGLIFGAIALLIMCVTIVKLTNRMYEGEKASAAASH